MTTPVEPARLVAAHRAARAFYREQLLDAYGPRRYLVERGLGPLIDRAEPWWLGYAPGWTCLVDHLALEGFAPEELLAGGLAVPGRRGGIVDAFRDRVMFPIHDVAGDPIAFIGRAAPGAKTPKYFNTRQTTIYRKSETLYGIGEQAERFAAGWTPVLVEGPIDVLAVYLARPDHVGVGCAAVSACGTGLSRQHVAAITSLSGALTRRVVLAYDNDSGGQAATERAWHILPREIDLHAAGLPAGLDPGDLIVRSGGLDDLREALTSASRPLVEAVIEIHFGRLLERRPDGLTHVEGQLAFVRHLTALITDLPPEQIIALAGYIARRTGAAIELVTGAVMDGLERRRTAPARSPLPPPRTREEPTGHQLTRGGPPIPPTHGRTPASNATRRTHTPQTGLRPPRTR
jgi:DNA primase